MAIDENGVIIPVIVKEDAVQVKNTADRIAEQIGKPLQSKLSKTFKNVGYEAVKIGKKYQMIQYGLDDKGNITSGQSFGKKISALQVEKYLNMSTNKQIINAELRLREKAEVQAKKRAENRKKKELKNEEKVEVRRTVNQTNKRQIFKETTNKRK